VRYQDALIAWTPGTDQIKVGNIVQRGDLMLFIEFNTIVVRDNVSVEAAHKAFLAIDEYRERISPDIEGADWD
jgi:hypothetical protein